MFMVTCIFLIHFVLAALVKFRRFRMYSQYVLSYNNAGMYKIVSKVLHIAIFDSAVKSSSRRATSLSLRLHKLKSLISDAVGLG